MSITHFDKKFVDKKVLPKSVTGFSDDWFDLLSDKMPDLSIDIE